MNTVIQITDNTLAEPLSSVCRHILTTEAQGLPIVCVSQKPVDWPEARRVVVGEIGRSWRSFYSQILRALDEVETETVAIAEHDCFYTHGALSYQPPDLSVFWYNRNHYFVEWGGNHPEINGMYSRWPGRLPFSQLVCSTSLLRSAVEEIYRLLDMGLRVEKGMKWYGEPGVIDDKLRRAFVEADSGRPTQLQRYLKEYVTHYDHKTFASEYPSLDCRHSTNFTGPRRGTNRVYTLPYWGRFSDVMEGRWGLEDVMRG